MNRQPKQIGLPQLCRMFEISINDVPDMKPAPMAEMEEKVAELKKVFKKAYRKLAMRYHPDKGATEKQIEHFKMLTSAYKNICNLKVQPLRPPPAQVIIRTSFRSFGGGTTSSSTTTTGGWTRYYTSSGGGSGDGST